MILNVKGALYVHLKLYVEALKALGRRVIDFDTDSVLIIGLWSLYQLVLRLMVLNKISYVNSGFKNIMKVKGFSLHFDDQQIVNFESLKEKVLQQETCKTLKCKLTMHCNKIIA